MNQKYLDEIRAREQAATPGPWEVGDGSERHFHNGRNTVIAAPLRVVADRATYSHIGSEHSGFDEQTYADMLFIAHSRKDIPALLDEVERLQAELDKYKPHSQAISALPSCNTCADSRSCTNRPKPGEWVRINCYMWRGPKSGRGDRNETH